MTTFFATCSCDMLRLSVLGGRRVGVVDLPSEMERQTPLHDIARAPGMPSHCCPNEHLPLQPALKRVRVETETTKRKNSSTFEKLPAAHRALCADDDPFPDPCKNLFIGIVCYSTFIPECAMPYIAHCLTAAGMHFNTCLQANTPPYNLLYPNHY